MEENISDYRYKDMILHTISSDYKHVRNKSYSDRTFDPDGIRATMSNIMYIGNLSRSAVARNTKSVVGRGVAMRAMNGEHSHNCNMGPPQEQVPQASADGASSAAAAK